MGCVVELSARCLLGCKTVAGGNGVGVGEDVVEGVGVRWRKGSGGERRAAERRMVRREGSGGRACSRRRWSSTGEGHEAKGEYECRAMVARREEMASKGGREDEKREEVGDGGRWRGDW